jgi:hypothetical protein
MVFGQIVHLPFRILMRELWDSVSQQMQPGDILTGGVGVEALQYTAGGSDQAPSPMVGAFT